MSSGSGSFPYSPLGRGFLTGAVKRAEDYGADYRAIDPRFQGSNFDRNQSLIEHVRAIASNRGATAAQVALAWVLAQGEDVVPIPGTTRIANLEENVGADRVHLTPEDLSRLDLAFRPGVTAGARYNEAYMKLIDSTA